MREGKFLVAVFKVRGQRGEMTAELKWFAIRGQFEPGGVTPAGEPLQEFKFGKHQCFVAFAAIAVGLGQPLNECPIRRRKQFLLMGRPRHQVDHVCQRADLFASARPKKMKLHSEAVAGGILVIGQDLAQDAQCGAWCVQQRLRGREEPVFQGLHELLLMFGFFHLGKAVEIGMRLQLVRDGATSSKKQEGDLLQAAVAARGQHPGPPVGGGKILPREG